MILHVLALLPALWLAPGQEPQKKDEHPPIVAPLAGNADDPHQQMLKLIGEVELRLRQIDKLLTEASAAQRDASSPNVRTAEFVKRSQDEGRQVIEGIDKILELADHPHPAGGS
jgi:hypothetical protein